MENKDNKIMALNDLNADQFLQITNLQNTNRKLLEALRIAIVDLEYNKLTDSAAYNQITSTLKAPE